MKRPIVLVDLDGVVGKFVDAFLVAYAEAGGDIPLGFEVNTWGFPDLLPNQNAVAKAWRNPDIFEQQEPYPRAIEGLRILNDNFGLLIVTSAAPPLGVHIPAKMRWMARHAPFITPSQFIFTARKEMIRGKIFIDDYAVNCLAWQVENRSGSAYLIARPWNDECRDEVRAAGAIVFDGELYELALELTNGK